MRNFIIFYLFFGFSVACFAQNNAVLSDHKFVSTNWLTSNIMLIDKQSYSIEKDELSAIYTINKDTTSYLYKVKVQSAFYAMFLFVDFGVGCDFHFRTKESRHSWGLGSNLAISSNSLNPSIYAYYTYGIQKSFIEAGWIFNYYHAEQKDASASHFFSHCENGYLIMPYLGYRYQSQNSSLFFRIYAAPYAYLDLAGHESAFYGPIPPSTMPISYSRDFQIKGVGLSGQQGFGVSLGYTLPVHF